MRFDILTLFPEAIAELTKLSILGRAQKKQAIEVNTYNLRDWGLGPHQQVDDTPYGGGGGMLLRADVVIPAIKEITAKNKTKPYIILLTPQGRRFTQAEAEKLATKKRLLLVCGHYEGFDERIRAAADDQISIGDFVLTGGELPALAVVDAVARLVPGVLRSGAANNESHSLKGEADQRLLEYPQYTKPEVYAGKKVPATLISGDHASIDRWRAAHTHPASPDTPDHNND